VAEAEIVTFAPVLNVAPDAGLVMDTVGGWLDVEPTLMLTGAEVVFSPALSVATAVSE
jgi:hypothetical protein